MSFHRFLGALLRAPSAPDAETETATVRRIVGQLEALPPDQARYLAGFAYVLSRVADADLVVNPDETRRMEEIVVQQGGLTAAQAVLAVEIARSQSRLEGGTEDYLVTREFSQLATEEQRRGLLRCCFLVASSDGSISAGEGGVLTQISDELELDRDQLRALRVEFADRIAAVQAMRRARGVAAAPPAGAPDAAAAPVSAAPDAPDAHASAAPGTPEASRATPADDGPSAPVSLT